jgi:hypothetical protein
MRNLIAPKEQQKIFRTLLEDIVAHPLTLLAQHQVLDRIVIAMNTCAITPAAAKALTMALAHKDGRA